MQQNFKVDIVSDSKYPVHITLSIDDHSIFMNMTWIDADKFLDVLSIIRYIDHDRLYNEHISNNIGPTEQRCSYNIAIMSLYHINIKMIHGGRNKLENGMNFIIDKDLAGQLRQLIQYKIKKAHGYITPKVIEKCDKCGLPVPRDKEE